MPNNKIKYLKIINVGKMWCYLYIIYVCITFGQSCNANGTLSSTSTKEESKLDCANGILLSTSICIPDGYSKGEVPEIPTVVNTRFEINNIREVNDKKMRITIDFYLELVWVDNRIKTKLSANNISVLNNILIDNIWKPDLWIKNLVEFNLHGVLEPTSGLIIMDKEHCEAISCTENESKRNTLVTYNFESQATIYCNFHFLSYPMDVQYCEFTMDGAYPYPNIVNFSFELGLFGVTNKNTNIDDFEIEITFENKNNQTGIHGVIKLERCIFPFIIKYYLPCTAIIIMSLMSVVISKENRVALLVTQFLTMTNILIAQQVYI